MDRTTEITERPVLSNLVSRDVNTNSSHDKDDEVSNDDLSSLGDASPMNDGETKRTNSTKQGTARSRPCWCHSNSCRITFVAIYCILYLSLSSNPQVVLVSNENSSRIGSASQSDGHAHDRPTANLTDTQLAALRRQHIIQVVDSKQLYHVYQPMSPSRWCIDSRLKFEQAKRRPMGLCYLKIPHAQSNVLQGITERIARNFLVNLDKRQASNNATDSTTPHFSTNSGKDSSCIRHDGHTTGTYYQKRNRDASFLFTFVRDPVDRALSRIASNMVKKHGKEHFRTIISKQQQEPFQHKDMNSTDRMISGEVLEALQYSNDVQFGTISEGRGGFQLQYSMLHVIPAYSAWNESQPNSVLNPQRVQHNVQRLLHPTYGYDFIGVVERLKESLVVLQLLLGLEATDMLYLENQLDPMPYERRVIPGSKGQRYYCQENILDPKKEFVVGTSGPVEEYLSSTTWWAQNYGDYLLHRAASRSLDATINRIGRDLFNDAMKEFESVLEQANNVCQPQTILPCSLDNGADNYMASLQNCYHDNSEEESLACGYPCLDQFN